MASFCITGEGITLKRSRQWGQLKLHLTHVGRVLRGCSTVGLLALRSWHRTADRSDDRDGAQYKSWSYFLPALHFNPQR